VVRGPPGDLDQLRRAAGAGRRHRRLEQVAEAVQLVAEGQLAVSRGLTGPAVRGAEIAVPGLRPDERRGQGADLGGVLVGVPAERLDELVDLGVGELAAGAVGRGSGEVAGPAEPVHPGPAVREGGGAVGRLPLAPEAAGEADGGQRDRLQHAGYRPDGSTPGFAHASLRKSENLFGKPGSG
jgi:hypothetical protein